MLIFQAYMTTEKSNVTFIGAVERSGFFFYHLFSKQKILFEK